jgi:ribonuclease HII
MPGSGILGIDEAGRGPVLGPLVIAAFACREEDLPGLREMGIRDSKTLSVGRREALYQDLAGSFAFRVEKLFPRELDAAMAKASLNEIEGRHFAHLLGEMEPEVAYIDCPDPRPSTFVRRLLRYYSGRTRLVVEHRADERYLPVSAASIVAKVERDREIEELRKEYGEVGSGYSSDPKTRAFLTGWYRDHGAFPDFVRRRWKTARRVGESRLSDFL